MSLPAVSTQEAERRKRKICFLVLFSSEQKQLTFDPLEENCSSLFLFIHFTLQLFVHSFCFMLLLVLVFCSLLSFYLSLVFRVLYLVYYICMCLCIYIHRHIHIHIYVGLVMSQQDVMRSAGCSDVAAGRMCSGSDRKLGEDDAAATPAGGERNNQSNLTPEREGDISSSSSSSFCS